VAPLLLTSGPTRADLGPRRSKPATARAIFFFKIPLLARLPTISSAVTGSHSHTHARANCRAARRRLAAGDRRRPAGFVPEALCIRAWWSWNARRARLRGPPLARSGSRLGFRGRWPRRPRTPSSRTSGTPESASRSASVTWIRLSVCESVWELA
jgi:hypothetical protein